MSFRVFAFFSLLIGGCGGMYNDGFKSDLEKRAAFDMDCPNSQLRYQELSEASNDLVTSYGVRGCGRQATYILNVQSGVWVMNTDDKMGK